MSCYIFLSLSVMTIASIILYNIIRRIPDFSDINSIDEFIERIKESVPEPVIPDLKDNIIDGHFLKLKDGSLVDLEELILVQKKKGGSRLEDFCRDYLERKFGRRFPTVRPDWLKNPRTGHNLELDCYCEEIGLALEYNGPQHYIFPNPYNATEKEFREGLYRDRVKESICRRIGLTLISVPYNIKENKICEFIDEQLKDFVIVPFQPPLRTVSPRPEDLVEFMDDFVEFTKKVKAVKVPKATKATKAVKVPKAVKATKAVKKDASINALETVLNAENSKSGSTSMMVSEGKTKKAEKAEKTEKKVKAEKVKKVTKKKRDSVALIDPIFDAILSKNPLPSLFFSDKDLCT